MRTTCFCGLQGGCRYFGGYIITPEYPTPRYPTLWKPCPWNPTPPNTLPVDTLPTLGMLPTGYASPPRRNMGPEIP